MPECRIKLISTAEYDPVTVIGDIAHIEAHGNGPRENPALTAEDRANEANLILLCKICHAKFDGQVLRFSVAAIRRIKSEHEAWVDASLPERGRSRQGWRVLLFEGVHPIDQPRALLALAPDHEMGSPQILRMDPTAEGWPGILTRVRHAAADLLAAESAESRAAVFPLAPVSACIALGFFLTSRSRVRLFQYHRDAHTWVWPRSSGSAAKLKVQGMPRGIVRDVKTVAIFFHLSATIAEASTARGDFDIAIHVRVPKPSTAWLSIPEQLTQLSQIARQIFERLGARAPRATRWHLFYAGPAPGAVCVGQQINPTMSPQVQLYEFRNPGHVRSLILAADTRGQPELTQTAD